MMLLSYSVFPKLRAHDFKTVRCIIAFVFLCSFLALTESKVVGQLGPDWQNRLVNPPSNPARPGDELLSDVMNYLWEIRGQLPPDAQLRLLAISQQYQELQQQKREVSRRMPLGDPKTAEQRQAALEMGELMQQDDAFTTQTFDELVEIMGPHLDDFIVRQNRVAIHSVLRRSFRAMDEDAVKNPQITPELLLNLASYLHLSDEQIERLKGQNELETGDEQDAVEAARRRLREIQSEMRKAVEAVLSTEQRKKFDQAIPDLIEWPLRPNDPRERLANELKMESSGLSGRLQGDAGRKIRGDVRLSRMLHEGDRKGLEQEGFEIRDRFPWYMLTDKSVQRELEITDEQSREIGQRLRELLRENSDWLLTDRFGDERTAQIISGNASIPPELEECLLEHQKPNFLAVELQVRLFSHWPTLTLLSPQMRLHLGLTPDQIAEIEAISAEHLEKVEKVWADLQQEIVDTNESRESRVLQVLNSQQRERLEAALALIRATESSSATK